MAVLVSKEDVDYTVSMTLELLCLATSESLMAFLITKVKEKEREAAYFQNKEKPGQEEKGRNLTNNRT